ncbi:MAG: peptidoglycan DD-metalloendopeptidase family protein [Bacteroidales bacterium]|nr:peptidoglycan DD-metalloendopeptidase family protein [Bacteroidales bacterium]
MGRFRAALVMTLLSLCASAQDRPAMSLKRAEILVPRPAKHPVKSLIPGEGAPAVDTLDTSDPRVKLLLRSDHSWEYFRDPVEMDKDPEFTDHWDTRTINPYREALADLPSRVTLWLVDSASRWTCPRTVPVYSKFGRRRGRMHMGVDLPLQTGTPVYAAFSGKVRISQYNRSFGNVIIIRHPSGLETTYAHLSQRDVSAGDWVSSGDVIGLGGSTGRSTGPHLHFETRWHGYAFDPQWIADFGKGELRSGVFVLKTKHLLPGSNYVARSVEDEDEIFRTEEEERAEAERIAAELAAAKYHKVVSGDTLMGLARKYGTSVYEICRLNGIGRDSKIKIGQTLRVR